VFDQVSVERYSGYVERFKELQRPSGRYVGHISESDVQMASAVRNDPAFFGPLNLRMAVACVEMAQAGMGDRWSEEAISFLREARNLGYPDAKEMMNQITTLGLGSLFDKFTGSVAEGAAEWRQADASGTRPQLKISPPINLAERLKIYAQRRQAEQERVAAAARAAEEAARQKATAEAARTEETARQKLAAEAGTIHRTLKAVDARWRAAGIDYPLLAPLSRQREASLVQETLSALAQYEEGVVRRGSQPKQVRGLEAMKAALASANCSPSVAANCMPLLIASDEAYGAYLDQPLNTIRHHVGVVECHARRLPVACRRASEEAGRSAENGGLTKELAYLTLSCVSPGEMKGFTKRCDFIAYFLLKGDYGSPDTALANDLYRIACAYGDSGSCEKVVADASSAPAPEPAPLPGKARGKTQTTVKAAPARASQPAR